MKSVKIIWSNLILLSLVLASLPSNAQSTAYNDHVLTLDKTLESLYAVISGIFFTRMLNLYLPENRNQVYLVQVT